MGAGGGRYGVDKKGEKNENGIQWSSGALDRSEMARHFLELVFNGFGEKFMVKTMNKHFFPQHYVEGLLNSRPRVESVHTEIAIFRPPPCTGQIVVIVSLHTETLIKKYI